MNKWNVGRDMCARVMAFDYGDSRIGVAIGDRGIGVATGLPTIEYAGRKNLRSLLQELIEDQQPEQFVVGYPLNMDGSHGERCRVVEDFVHRLKGWFGRPVTLWDERLTSVEAGRIQKEAGVTDRKARSKGMVDRAAAILLLQSWFDSPDRTGLLLEKEAKEIEDRSGKEEA